MADILKGKFYLAAMPDPRSILLEFLSTGAALTQADAVRRLRLSERTARRHLRRLELDGLVEVRQKGRG